jgi:hypothetical protein
LEPRPELAWEDEIWIKQQTTNLASADTTSEQNDSTAQDLDDILDEHVIPAFSQWRIAVRTQGSAYTTAYERFTETLNTANQQAKDRADMFAAVLTAVSVGSLGWIGDAVINGDDFAKLLKSDAARGALEDALQAAVGESIDLRQGGWFKAHVSRETHPNKYQNSVMNQIDALVGELTEKMGSTKALIRRTDQPIERAAVLVKVYDWWNRTLAKKSPKSQQSDEPSMAKAFETTFWQQYILQELTKDVMFLFWGWGRKYEHPEKAVRQRLDYLGVSAQAGIKSWMEWYEASQVFSPDTEIDPKTGREKPYLGSDDTQKLAAWASSYVPNTFD